MDALPDFVVQWTRFFASNAPSFFSALLRFGILLRSLIMPLFARVANQPDLASVAVLAIAVVMSLLVLNILRRVVWYWITSMFWLAFWGIMLFALMWVYTRGVEQAILDLGEIINGYLGEVSYHQEQADAHLGREKFW